MTTCLQQLSFLFLVWQGTRLHIGLGHAFSHFGDGTPKFKILAAKLWPSNSEYLKNGKYQRYMSSIRFLKMYSMGR